MFARRRASLAARYPRKDISKGDISSLKKSAAAFAFRAQVVRHRIAERLHVAIDLLDSLLLVMKGYVRAPQGVVGGTISAKGHFEGGYQFVEEVRRRFRVS